MQERIQKILSAAGVAARRKAEDLIRAGAIKVNGRTAKIGDKADAGKDTITVYGRSIRRQKHVIYMFHKPHGYLTALPGGSGKRTIFQLFKVRERVFPVGRLDVATEGLLLLTNDGALAQKIMHPKHEITKTYQAQLDRPLDPKEREIIENGLELEDDKGKRYRTTAVKVTFPVRNHRNVEVTVRQGKYRIVRRIFASRGYTVKKLIRTKIGQLNLGALPSGEWRRLTETEIQRIFQ